VFVELYEPFFIIKAFGYELIASLSKIALCDADISSQIHASTELPAGVLTSLRLSANATFRLINTKKIIYKYLLSITINTLYSPIKHF